MNKFRCLIVDDEELARELLQSHISQLHQFELVGSCASAIEANQILKQNSVDLLFLDIEMPVLKGTDFYKNLLHKPKVIFTTAYRDYALEGFELDAVDYLLKPIVFSRFFNAIEKFLNTQVIQQFETQELENSNTYILLKKDRKQIRVNLQDILYVQGLKDYLKIHLESSSHVVKYTMTQLENMLGSGFMRIHRSYIVNLEKITAFTKQDVEIGAHEIPISKNCKHSLLAILETKNITTQ
ncbi:LytR/AlgR family response regulator transcription factor [Marinicella sp. W31]|uniref:LytR/AlgR family response regulator transcription factor n=1 Tax=Marinicella sp. W31 TaxID=3023713 RepID=UPI003756AB36